MVHELPSSLFVHARRLIPAIGFIAATLTTWGCGAAAEAEEEPAVASPEAVAQTGQKSRAATAAIPTTDSLKSQTSPSASAAVNSADSQLPTKQVAAGSTSTPPSSKSRTDSARPAAPRVNAESIASARRDSAVNAMWPVKGPEPLPGSILPHKRIIAFYGNPLSTRMGVLGEYEPDDMLRRLDAEVAAWELADPATPVQPALHLIAVVAQASPGRDGKYRLRMDSAVIERVAGWANRRNALVFLDLQVGLSTLREELPYFERFLSRPNFHVGIDPEFSMKNGGLPGKRIGTYDAADVNFASSYLAGLVTAHNLPPKVLVVHRFTQRGLTNYQNIKLDPRVQVVIHMDGFGSPTLKRGTFKRYVKAEPVQFVGWKQFFKSRNDKPRTTIAEILKLWPRVLYIQYQ